MRAKTNEFGNEPDARQVLRDRLRMGRICVSVLVSILRDAPTQVGYSRLVYLMSRCRAGPTSVGAPQDEAERAAPPIRSPHGEERSEAARLEPWSTNAV